MKPQPAFPAHIPPANSLLVALKGQLLLSLPKLDQSPGEVLCE